MFYMKILCTTPFPDPELQDWKAQTNAVNLNFKQKWWPKCARYGGLTFDLVETPTDTESFWPEHRKQKRVAMGHGSRQTGSGSLEIFTKCLSMVSATENQPKKPQGLFTLKDRHARLDLPATPPKYNNKSQESGAVRSAPMADPQTTENHN